MILVADSGSTKTDWRIAGAGSEVEIFNTIGLNPFFVSAGKIASEIRSSFPTKNQPSVIKEIYFYGAGCSSEDRNTIIKEGLLTVFPQAAIEINSDLLGAARALFRNEAGIAIIMGTGSNSCYYDGKIVAANVNSLGYLLGDEGSGAYFGKMLLKYFLYNELPGRLHSAFTAQFGLDRNDILNSVYRNTMPNRFLASFGKFLCTNREHPFIAKMIYSGFEEFFNHHVSKYKDYQQLRLRCLGSIAFNFSTILIDVAHSKNCTIDKIIKFPIDELVKYHIAGIV